MFATIFIVTVLATFTAATLRGPEGIVAAGRRVGAYVAQGCLG